MVCILESIGHAIWSHGIQFQLSLIHYWKSCLDGKWIFSWEGLNASSYSRCSFSMMVKWVNDSLLQAIYVEMLVNDGEMSIWSLVIHSFHHHLRAFCHHKLEVNNHSLIWQSLRSCTDCRMAWIFCQKNDINLIKTWTCYVLKHFIKMLNSLIKQMYD